MRAHAYTLARSHAVVLCMFVRVGLRVDLCVFFCLFFVFFVLWREDDDLKLCLLSPLYRP